MLLAQATEPSGGQLLAGTILLLVIVAGYFIPTIIAVARKHPNVAAIAAVNLLLGWTLVGFVVALAWSLMNPDTREHRHVHYHERGRYVEDN